MRTVFWIGFALVASVMSGVSAEGPAHPTHLQAGSLGSDTAMEHASDHSRLLRDADGNDEQAGGHGPADDASSEDRRCDEFATHGAYVSSVAEDKPERPDDVKLEDRITLGSLVRVAAQSDVGKCGGHEDGANDTHAAEGREHRNDGPADEEEDDEDGHGRSAQARADHPPQNG